MIDSVQSIVIRRHTTIAAMKLHSNSHLRRASSFPMFVLLLLLLVSTCQASPVPAEQKEAEKPNAEPAATAVGKPQSEVVVVAAAVEAAADDGHDDDAEADGGAKSDSLEAASARVNNILHLSWPNQTN